MKTFKKNNLGTSIEGSLKCICACTNCNCPGYDSPQYDVHAVKYWPVMTITSMSNVFGGPAPW